MSINVKKTKFIVINNDVYGKEPIESGNIVVKYCSSCLYLGAYITDDGSYTSSINLHVNAKKKHFLKYVSFLQKNNDFPFIIKKRVAKVCIFSSILNGYETWCCSTYGNLETIYMGIIKTLLAVRQTSCNDICLVECDMPTLKAAIRYRQYKYLTEKFKCLEGNSTLKFALNLVESVITASYKIIKEMLGDLNIINKDKHKLVNAIKLNTVSSKRTTCMSVNPSLSSPKLY